MQIVSIAICIGVDALAMSLAVLPLALVSIATFGYRIALCDGMCADIRPFIISSA